MNSKLEQTDRGRSAAERRSHRRHRRRRWHPDLRDYFETAIGSGYLATAGLDGAVNLALYDRPLVIEEDLVAFGMKRRKTHDNLRENPQAAYAYHEPGQRRGLRLSLQLEREETSGDLLDKLKRRAGWLSGPAEAEELRYVVFFRVTDVLPLVVR